MYLPIWAEWPRRMRAFCLTASLIRSTSCWYLATTTHRHHGNYHCGNDTITLAMTQSLWQSHNYNLRNNTLIAVTTAMATTLGTRLHQKEIAHLLLCPWDVFTSLWLEEVHYDMKWPQWPQNDCRWDWGGVVPLPVAHGTLLGLLQCPLQRLHPLHGGAQTLLQLGQFTSQVSIVSHQLQTQPHQLQTQPFQL